jgi:hypothetical protein
VGLGAIHRIGALARTPALGSSAWRLKFANDPTSYTPMYHQLLRRAARELHLPTRRRRLQLCVVQAICEWLISACAYCGGTGFRTKRVYLRVVCESCGGDGARGWSTAKRAAALHMDMTEFENGPWALRLNHINALIRSIDLETEVVVRRQLGLRR